MQTGSIGFCNWKKKKQTLDGRVAAQKGTVEELDVKAFAS